MTTNIEPEFPKRIAKYLNQVPLEKRSYDNPQIHLSVAQVVVDWGTYNFQEICKVLRPTLEARYGEISERVVIAGTHAKVPSPNESFSPEFKTEFGGLEAKLGYSDAVIRIEQSGVLVHIPGRYKGREQLFAAIDEPLQMLSQVAQDISASRVSVLISSNIDPATHTKDPVFQIEDFIVPNFEFKDPNLNHFINYSHDVFIDLQNLADQTTARVTVQRALMGRNGIDLSIDVLDHSVTSLLEVHSRLGKVKDLESHIFESTITDITRKLYGINNN